VKAAAEAWGLRVGEDLSAVADVGVEAGVVVAYGALVPASLLEIVPMLNVHFSLLPRWRGAAPVERAILAGDEVTGVCVMGLEASLDTGPVFARASTPVGEKYAEELTAELSHTGAKLLIDVLARTPWPTPVPQAGEATYAAKLAAADFELDPARGAEDLARIVRAGRATCHVEGRRLVVVRARVGSGSTLPGQLRVDGGEVSLGTAAGELVLEQIVPENSRAMAPSAWLSGARLPGDARWSK
jgi:methionyl-tRNA formyltransferase